VSVVDGILALLRADTNLTVYDGAPPASPAYPIVIVYGNNGTRTPSDVAGRSRQVDVRVQCTVHAVSTESARIVADRVVAALVDRVPTATGFACGPVRQESSPPSYADDSIAQPVVIQPLLFTVSAVVV
jgi:hypothetical protein